MWHDVSNNIHIDSSYPDLSSGIIAQYINNNNSSGFDLSGDVFVFVKSFKLTLQQDI